MNIKRNTIFLPDKEKGKQDAKLRYRIKWDGNTVAFNVGYRIDTDKWAKDAQRCKMNTTHGKKKVSASVINKEINNYEEIAEKIFIQFEKENKAPSADEFRAEFNKHLGKIEEPNEDFFSVFDKFIKRQSLQNSWAAGTKKRMTNVKNHLKRFDESISFAMINENNISQFIKYLLGIGLKNTTVERNVSLLKWFLRWSKKNGYYQLNAHETFKPHLKGTDGKNKEIIHLSWEELIKVYEHNFGENKLHLSQTRDVFCFCCFTGLRYSDVSNLKITDIKDGYISIVTQKTSNALRIELNKYSKAILDKYKEITLKNNLALPVISNQKMNKYLKEMAEMCELNDEIKIVSFHGSERVEEIFPKHKLISTHCGRRTFIVNALYLGIPAEVVMKWTGHSGYEAMKPYIKIVDELKAKEMDKFNQKQ
jgi:integrase